MAKQCKLTLTEFNDLIDCPLTVEKYDVIIKNKNK